MILHFSDKKVGKGEKIWNKKYFRKAPSKKKKIKRRVIRSPPFYSSSIKSCNSFANSSRRTTRQSSSPTTHSHLGQNKPKSVISPKERGAEIGHLNSTSLLGVLSASVREDGRTVRQNVDARAPIGRGKWTLFPSSILLWGKSRQMLGEKRDFRRVRDLHR